MEVQAVPQGIASYQAMLLWRHNSLVAHGNFDRSEKTRPFSVQSTIDDGHLNYLSSHHNHATHAQVASGELAHGATGSGVQWVTAFGEAAQSIMGSTPG